MQSFLSQKFRPCNRYRRFFPYSLQNISAESYQKLSDELGEGVIVKHRKFGKGVVTEIEGEHIRIRFGDDEKKMDLKVLARLGLLEI